MYSFNNNNYMQPYNRQEIIRVNGENGARAYQMGPGSSALLLDETDALVWLAQTDGAGYKTVTPYRIEPYQVPKAPDLTDILTRITNLEEKVNGKSNITDAGKE